MNTHVILTNYKSTFIFIFFVLLSTVIFTFIIITWSEHEIIKSLIDFTKCTLAFLCLGLFFHIQHYYSFIVSNNEINLKHPIIGTTIIDLSTIKSIKVSHRYVRRVGYEPSFEFFFNNGTKKKIFMYHPEQKAIETMLNYLEINGIEIIVKE